MTFQKKFNQAGNWIAKAAMRGDAEAIKLASLTEFASCWFKPTEISLSFHWLQRAADLKDAEARYALGLCYEAGYLVAQDDVIAVSLFLLAACQGHRLAQSKIAEAYTTGRGVPRNLYYAARWRQKLESRQDNHSSALFGN